MSSRAPGTVGEVFGVFLRLGLTSFGGPVAHLGFFRDALVTRRKWLSDTEYADLVALCQFLPGPASSQVGMALGLRRAGWAGMAAAWVAFTLPSALLLLGFAYGIDALGGSLHPGWLIGLKATVVAVVFQAVAGMARSLTPDLRRAAIAVLVLALVLLWPHPLTPVAGILLGGLLGLLLVPAAEAGATPPHTATGFRVSRRTGIIAGGLFTTLLLVLPMLAGLTGNGALHLTDVFYRAGSLVFGGGHVVLPLLEAETVRTGLVDQETFIAGYGAAQAVPGPLFTFAAYLGALVQTPPGGVLGSALALLAIFLPAALLLIAALPFWDRLRAAPRARRVVAGINAAVVGILAAALYDPVITAGIVSWGTVVLAVLVFAGLHSGRLPAWAAVILAAVIGRLLL